MCNKSIEEFVGAKLHIHLTLNFEKSENLNPQQAPPPLVSPSSPHFSFSIFSDRTLKLFDTARVCG